MQALSADWIFPLGAAIAAAILALIAFGLRNGMFSKSRIELAVALEQLRGLKWRKFAGFVVALLEKRGLSLDEQDRQPGEGGVDLMMRRGNARYIVQCKHGGAYHLNDAGQQELVKLINMQGAAGAILVNAGMTDPTQRATASKRGIEVLEGKELWQQLEPRLPFDIVEHIHQETTSRLQKKRRSALAAAGLFAVIGGVAGFLLKAPLHQSPTEVTAPPVRAPASSPAPETAPPPAPQAAPATSDVTSTGVPAAMPDPNMTEAQAEERRGLAENAVRALTGVREASWSTRSTMVLVLPLPADIKSDAPTVSQAEASGAPSEDPLAPIVQVICDELTQYEELRYTRLQISYADPRNEDEARVRWRQCR